MRVWQRCIGNQLRITQGIFDAFREHARAARRRMADAAGAGAGWATGGAAAREAGEVRRGHEDSLGVLDRDLPRTFASLGFFHRGGPLEAQLREVLEAYVFYRPDVGYVQGMSFLAAMLLLTMDTFPAFVALANLLHSHYFLSFFAMDMHEVRVRFAVFEELLAEQLPQLFRSFRRLGVTTDVFLLNWLMTLFAKSPPPPPPPCPYCTLTPSLPSRSLPIDITSRIWDNYLLQGEAFMLRAALGVLKWLSAQCVDQPLEEQLVILTHLHAQVPRPALLSLLQASPCGVCGAPARCVVGVACVASRCLWSPHPHRHRHVASATVANDIHTRWHV